MSITASTRTNTNNANNSVTTFIRCVFTMSFNSPKDKAAMATFQQMTSVNEETAKKYLLRTKGNLEVREAGRSRVWFRFFFFF